MKVPTERMKFPEKIFIAGTDTGIGKTLVSAILLSGLEGRYWKPIQSGLEEVTDTQWIKEKTGLDDRHFYPETCRFKKPLSPHASAAAEGKRIDLEQFEVPEPPEGETLVIEGAGGIMVPLNEKDLMIDLIKKISAPVLIVCRSGLGTINHTLLSINQLRTEGIHVLGVVMNGPRNGSNRDAIERFGNIRVVAEIEEIKDINPGTLKDSFMKQF